MGAVALAATSVQAQSWDEIVAKAKQEGTVVVYSNLVGDPTLKAVAQFTKVYGIKVDVLEEPLLKSANARARSRPQAAFWRRHFYASKRAGGVDRPRRQVLCFACADAEHKSAEERVQTRRAVRAGHEHSLRHSHQYECGEAGGRAEDMGRYTIRNGRARSSDDTRAIGGGYLIFATLNWPRSARRFMKSSRRTIPSSTGPCATIRAACGELPIYIPFIYTDIINLKGLPVKAIIPKEGSPYVTYGHVVNRNAPHPNAALVYIDYWMSEDVQMMWARTGMAIVRDGLAEKNTAEVRDMANTPLIGHDGYRPPERGPRAGEEIYSKTSHPMPQQFLRIAVHRTTIRRDPIRLRHPERQ